MDKKTKNLLLLIITTIIIWGAIGCGAETAQNENSPKLDTQTAAQVNGEKISVDKADVKINHLVVDKLLQSV